MFVSNLVGFMKRDATEFLAYGVESTDITAFETLGNEFEVFPTDEEYQADVTIATETKEAKADELRLAIRSVSVRAETKFGSNSGKYKKFAVVGMNQFNDRDLLICARRVVHVGGLFLTELASEGLTQAILDSLTATAQDFEDSLNALKDAIADRDIKAEERIAKGNELYSFVSKYCNFGKQIWENVSEAKYNDYVIYPTGTGGGGTPDVPPSAPELSYAPGEFYWDEVPTATSYQLVYRSSSETEWLELYAGPFPEGSITFEPGEGEWIARLRARNSAGYGDWSEEKTVFIGLRAPENLNLTFLGLPDNFLRLTWSPVIGADYYEVWRSVVALGLPAGEFTSQGTIPASPYQQVATLGMRTYYYLIAKNATQTSPHSATVFLDVGV
jgi:hypothetical protein